MTRIALVTIALVALAAALTACGGSAADKAAPGTPENPLVATHPEEASSEVGTSHRGSAGKQEPAPTAPGYDRLLEQQTAQPESRFSPCNLVPERQARQILGAPVQQPLEAPQGPTCIYRTRTGTDFVSVAIQTTPYERLKRLVRKREPIAVSGHEGVCGTVGQPTLFLPLADGRVLTIAAECDIAKQFAVRAVGQL